ncbi:MAG: NAD(P)/FAD-dependent oxidoreductase [Myxococcales bacterium]|nr:NAD(P)/FAD-dependent oxidoreductase [Myxococcales bacterium]
MAISLARAGIRDFVVLEKAQTLGGTWRDNLYPGCACDVPSHVYSFSFAPNPDWTETYATQAEIRRYMERCADQFAVRRHLRFGQEAVSATFDAESGRWTVTTASGETLRARIVVSGLGPLSRFSLPKLPGLERFRGHKFHSAAWDTSFDPRGKCIASIGTGASAIQFVPELAKTARRLHVFQRTPAWILPRRERRYRGLERWAFARVPGARLLHRQAIFWSHEVRGFAFVNEPRVLRLIERLALRHLRQSISDPELREKLTPQYRMGCKRILMSNTFYPALAQPNVELSTAGIRELTEHSVVGNDGVEREVDAVVFGTGFDVHDYLGSLRVTGDRGQELGALWAEHGAEAHLGTTVAGFPNLFMLVGPNTGLGHNSIIFMIESQLALVMRCVQLLRRKPDTYLAVRREAQDRFNERLQERLQTTVWHTGCRSWYLNESGKNTTIWPGMCAEFRLATARFEPRDYQLSVAGRDETRDAVRALSSA